MRWTVIAGFWLLLLLLAVAQADEAPYSTESYPDVNALIETINPFPPDLDKDGQVLTLQECLNRTRESHPALNAQWAAVLASNASLHRIWSLYYPSLDFTYYNDIQDTFYVSRGGGLISGAVLGLTQAPNSSLAITHTVFDVGERAAKVESARQTLRSTFLDYETAWISQVQKVEAAYIEVVKQESLVVVSLQDVERNRLVRQVAQKQLEAGTKSLVDVTQAEIQLADARASLAFQQAQVRNAWISLALAMGVPVDSIANRKLYNILGLDLELPAFEDSVKELETHPQILSFKAQALSSEATARAVRRGNGPNLMAKLSTQTLDNVGVTTAYWAVELTLNIPIFDPSVGPQVEEAEANLLRAVENAKNTKLELLQQLESAYSDHQGAEQRTSATLRQAKIALLNFELAAKRYQAGLTDYTELFNALSFLSTAQQSYINALADLRSAEVNVAQATGAAARYTKAYFREKAGEKLTRDLHEDLVSPEGESKTDR